MPVFDLVITGTQIVTADRIAPATLAIAGGRIAAILGPSTRPDADSHIDAPGLHVLPGVIDTHVHTRHPGDPAREDFRSGTMAAAAGGVTTLLEMPISKVPTNSADAFARRVHAMAPEALVDFGLYGGAGQENVSDIPGQAEAGAVAFKTFLQTPPAERVDEFRGLWCTDQAELRQVMAAVARTGRRHCFHCENEPMFLRLQHRLEAAGRTDGPAHADSRPPIVEETSVAMVLALAAEAGGPVHVVHVSSPRSAQLIREAAARGLPVTAETCPPYLFLTVEALREHGPFARCNPPLRSPEDVDGLWEQLLDGAIDFIGSDHSPFREEEKARGERNIFLAPPGLAGLEVTLPLMLSAVHDRRLTLPRLVRLLSQRAADLFQLTGKGRIAEGADADLTLVDLNARWTFDRDRCFTKARQTLTAYDGRPMHGRVVATLVRGQPVFRDGEITGTPGYGRLVVPGG